MIIIFLLGTLIKNRRIIMTRYEVFVKVIETGSFTKAAEVLHNNQPNITRCMNNLETELGCHLFVRSNRGVSLTPEGQKLFNHVAIAFEQLELGEAELKRDQSLTSGLISIGVSENALRIMLLSKLEAFHNHYPHVRLKISNHSTTASDCFPGKRTGGFCNCNNSTFCSKTVSENLPGFFPGNSDRRPKIQRTGFPHLLTGRTYGLPFRLAGK